MKPDYVTTHLPEEVHWGHQPAAHSERARYQLPRVLQDRDTAWTHEHPES